MRYSIRPDVALGVLCFDKEDMLRGDALGLDIADPTDDPAHRVFILFEGSLAPSEVRPCRSRENTA